MTEYIVVTRRLAQMTQVYHPLQGFIEHAEPVKGLLRLTYAKRWPVIDHTILRSILLQSLSLLAQTKLLVKQLLTRRLQYRP